MYFLPKFVAALSFASFTLGLVAPVKRYGCLFMIPRKGDLTLMLVERQSATATLNSALGATEVYPIWVPITRLRPVTTHLPVSPINIGLRRRWRCENLLVSRKEPRGRRGAAAGTRSEILTGSSPSVLFDGGLVADYLKRVKTFLDANPNEVITILFTNPDGASIADQWKPTFDASGITPLAYVPPHQPMSRSEWPTLSQLIDSGKRVIVFLDSGAAEGGVNFILPEFTNVWEPPFSSTDSNFPCSVDRIEGPLSAADHLYMLNHNLNVEIFGDILLSDRINAPTTNSVNSIIANANGCKPLANNLQPNFIMLDYVNVGEGMKAVNQLNGF
ncbi:hypothetical protein V5O48_005731 [Marasmius crinis-equi]|uniref:PLC-like phosphodiesterase n=1 Tax=Marasmius crinis-equi TaxID=585013 RepID=A0ABR3FLG8_9AGAR